MIGNPAEHGKIMKRSVRKKGDIAKPELNGIIVLTNGCPGKQGGLK
jgi:hypothetical protein